MLATRRVINISTLFFPLMISLLPAELSFDRLHIPVSEHL